MRKLEDVRKMVGCNGQEGAVVSTSQIKFSGADGEQKGMVYLKCSSINGSYFVTLFL